MIKIEQIKNKILQNRIEFLLRTYTVKGENWKYFINLVKNIIESHSLNFAQEVLLNKILDRIEKLKELTDLELRNLLFVLLRSNLNIFANIKIDVDNDNK